MALTLKEIIINRNKNDKKKYLYFYIEKLINLLKVSAKFT